MLALPPGILRKQIRALLVALGSQVFEIAHSVLLGVVIVELMRKLKHILTKISLFLPILMKWDAKYWAHCFKKGRNVFLTSSSE